MTVNPWILGGMVGLSGLKYLEDKQSAPHQRAMQAEIQRTSPWTGRQGQFVGDPSLTNYLMSGAVGGIGMGSQVGDITDLINKLNPSNDEAGGDDATGPKQKSIGGKATWNEDEPFWKQSESTPEKRFEHVRIGDSSPWHDPILEQPGYAPPVAGRAEKQMHSKQEAREILEDMRRNSAPSPWTRYQ